MQSSKLISALKTLDAKEMREFFDYLNSPYFNKETPVMRLGEILKKSYPGFNDKSILKEEVYKTLFPGKKYNDSVMRNIISKTMKLAEDFIITKEFEKNTDYYRTILSLRATGDKNQPFLFEKAKQRADKLLETVQNRDGMYYFLKFMYEDELRRYSMRKDSRMYIKEDNIQKVADNLSAFFISELLRYYAVMININKHSIERKFNFDFFRSILKAFEQNIDQFKTIHYANLYYNSIKLFNTEEEKYFERIRELVKKHYKSLPEIDRKNAYVVQINYCAERINKGDLHFLKKKLEIYKELLDRKAHYEGLPYISHVLYNGIAFAAINMGEMDWALKFINAYRRELTDAHRNNSYNTVMSEYYLRKGDTDKALEHLSTVQRTDSLYKEEVYFLLLKIFYSADMTESFYSEIDSFKNFLKESKQISERRKKLGKSFVVLVKKLYDAREKKKIGDVYDTYPLKKAILDNNYVSDKFWLLDKLSELE
jgi:hypothetical protein